MPKFNMEYHVQCVHSRKSLEGIFPNILFHDGKAEKHMAIFCFAVGMYGHTANWLFCRVPYMCHVFSSPAHGKLSILLYARCVSCACRQADDKVLICSVCCICRVLDNLQTTNDQLSSQQMLNFR